MKRPVLKSTVLAPARFLCWSADQWCSSSLPPARRQFFQFRRTCHDERHPTCQPSLRLPEPGGGQPVRAVRITASESGPFDWVWELTVKARSAEQARKEPSLTFTAKTNAGRVQLIVSLPNSSSSAEPASSRTSKSARPNRSPSRPGTVLAKPGSRACRGRSRRRAAWIHGDPRRRSQSARTDFVRDADARQFRPATLKNSHGSIAASNVRGSLDAETGFAPSRWPTSGAGHSAKPAWKRRGEPGQGEGQREDFVCHVAHWKTSKPTPH